jgi:hypothetical protein
MRFVCSETMKTLQVHYICMQQTNKIASNVPLLKRIGKSDLLKIMLYPIS